MGDAWFRLCSMWGQYLLIKPFMHLSIMHLFEHYKFQHI